MGNLLKHWRSTLSYMLLACILVSIGLFIYTMDAAALWVQLQQVGFKGLALIAISALAYGLSTASWWICLGAQRHKVSIPQLFMLRQIGENIALYNPTSVIAGDIYKAKLLLRYGIAKQNSLHSVALARITTLLSQLSLSTIICLALLMSTTTEHIQQSLGPHLHRITAVFILLQVAILWLLARKNPTNNPTAKGSNSPFSPYYRQLAQMVYDARQFFREASSTFWASYALSMAHWVIGAMEFYCILKILQMPISMLNSVFMDMSVLLMKSVAAMVPGQLGVEEIANKIALSSLGAGPASLWITVSIIRRMRQLFWLCFGALSLLIIPKPLYYGHAE